MVIEGLAVFPAQVHARDAALRDGYPWLERDSQTSLLSNFDLASN
jgi:hypothetical protein